MTVKVELFTADYCPSCARVKAALNDAVAELGPHRFEVAMLDVVRELDYAVELGVVATPAIAIDGKLACAGSVTTQKLKTILCGHLAKSTTRTSYAAISHR